MARCSALVKILAPVDRFSETLEDLGVDTLFGTVMKLDKVGETDS